MGRALLLAGVLAIAAGCGGGTERERASETAPRPAEAEPVAPQEKVDAAAVPPMPPAERLAEAAPRGVVRSASDPVDATQLLASFEINELAFDTAYKGKVVFVRGTVLAVRATPAVILGEWNNPYFANPCVTARLLPSEKAKAAKLDRETNVILKGTCREVRHGLVEVDGCTIVEVRPYAPPDFRPVEPKDSPLAKWKW